MERKRNNGKMFGMRKVGQRTCILLYKQKTIVDHWTPQGWKFNFKGQLNDWEIQSVEVFFKTIGKFNGMEVGQDMLWWKGNRKEALRWIVHKTG